MDHPLITVGLALVVLLMFAGLAGFMARMLRTGSRRRNTDDLATEQICYEPAISLLTAAELHFFQSLKNQIRPDLLICPKVRLADLLVVPKNALKAKSALNRILQKHVDFTLAEPATLRPVLAIELDDKSHDRPDRRDRDDFINQAFESASLTCLRVPLARQYQLRDVLQEIEQTHGIRLLP